jgi:hypothetical protein
VIVNARDPAQKFALAMDEHRSGLVQREDHDVARASLRIDLH